MVTVNGTLGSEATYETYVEVLLEAAGVTQDLFWTKMELDCLQHKIFVNKMLLSLSEAVRGRVSFEPCPLFLFFTSTHGG